MTDPARPEPVLKPRRGKRAAAVLILALGGLFVVGACQGPPHKKKGPPHRWGQVEMTLPHLHLPRLT